MIIQSNNAIFFAFLFSQIIQIFSQVIFFEEKEREVEKNQKIKKQNRIHAQL